jgi:hypothetical protein
LVQLNLNNKNLLHVLFALLNSDANALQVVVHEWYLEYMRSSRENIVATVRDLFGYLM